MSQHDFLRVRLPPPITDPELRTKFAQVSAIGFDIDALWSSVSGRLGLGVSDELWLHYMDELLESATEDINDSDVHAEYQERSKEIVANWDNYFNTCQEIYAHACMNYSMLYQHPILDASVHHFEYDPLRGNLVLLKEREEEEDREIKQALLPTHSYPYRNTAGPSYWN